MSESNFSIPQSEEERIKKESFLKILETPQDLDDWVFTFLGIRLPFGNVSGKVEDPKDDVIFGSPGDAIWEAYKAYRDDLYITNPGYIWLANRDGAKTLSGSILNVLLICHFKAEIAHLAAVRKQAEKCIEYTNVFIKKIKPYLEHHKRKIVSDSKNKIQIENEDGTVSFIDVIVANLAGGNSQRATVGSYDELDTLSKQGLVGYKEAQLIPTRKNEHGPLTIKYSTRKFVFGVFEQEIQNRANTGEKLVQWNILDITEKCTDSRSKKSSGNINERYTRRQLPLKIYTQKEYEEEYEKLPDKEKDSFKKINIYDGCLSCPLASICQGVLTERKDTDKARAKSLFKSIDFTIGQFRKTEAEMAEAQLLCWKPTTIGLIYPRFSEGYGDNAVTIDQAYELVTGDKTVNVEMEQLIQALHKYEARIYAGVDWGFTAHSVIVVMAVIPSGQSLILDLFSQPGLETHDFADIAEKFQEKYGIDKWFCDQASPSSIKTFKKKGLKCPEFKKDVQAGINSIRSQIITSTSVRRLKVVRYKDTEPVMEMFRKHHFVLDVAGNITKEPDSEIGIADVGDALRYIGQNVFASKSNKPVAAEADDRSKKVLPSSIDELKEKSKEINSLIMKQEIINRTGESLTGSQQEEDPTDPKKKKKGVLWSV